MNETYRERTAVSSAPAMSMSRLVLGVFLGNMLTTLVAGLVGVVFVQTDVDGVTLFIGLTSMLVVGGGIIFKCLDALKDAQGTRRLS